MDNSNAENQEAENEEKKKDKRKKKKVSKEKLQKKKEKKKFELEDQYKDLELPSFKSALVDNINLDVETPSKKKKKLTAN